MTRELQKIGTMLIIGAFLASGYHIARTVWGFPRPDEVQYLLRVLVSAVVGIGLQTIPRTKQS